MIEMNLLSSRSISLDTFKIVTHIYYQKFFYNICSCTVSSDLPIEEGRAVSKILIKNLAIFFLCPIKQFLPVSFKIQLLEYFPQNRRNNDKRRQDAYKLFNT
jgi:hypothetical protein